MRVLIACEESQTVCLAFRNRGIECYSCDIQRPSGGHEEWHIMGDVTPVLRGGVVQTMDGQRHYIGRWDLVIAHPPCTDLANSGARWFAEKQKDFRQQRAVAFFMLMLSANADRICIENPIGIMSTCYRKPDQIIQPYMFGEPFEKKTCLWLIGLPKLKPVNVCKPEPRIVFDSGKSMPKWYADCWGMPADVRQRIRSKTFEGIATAMAEQWGCLS